MLRIYTTARSGIRIHITHPKGRLGGPWVDELDTCWSGLAMNSSGGTMVDLTAMTFVDEKVKRS
jgi:hypothetical protein